jgi:hypothetical protein
MMNDTEDEKAIDYDALLSEIERNIATIAECSDSIVKLSLFLLSNMKKYGNFRVCRN